MSLLDSLKTAAMGAVGQEGQMGAIFNQLLSNNSGLTGLMEKFNSAGLSETVQSWIATGENLPISADTIQKVLGSTQVQSIAAQFGVDPQQISNQLASGLPKIIDQLSPNGQIPSMDQLTSKLADLKGLFN